MSKDYYKILGVTEFDTHENIKQAYRKLARQWHPDIAGNTPDVMKKFKEINEAYEILSNNNKKAEYDRAKHFYDYANTTSQNKEKKQETEKNTTNPQKNLNTFNFNWEDFFHKKQDYKKFKKNEKKPIKGDDIYSDVDITVIEAINGVNKVINMLQTQICPICNGRKFVNNSKCTHCQGKGELTHHKKFTVKIPAGIKNKSKIRLYNEGNKGLFGGKNGDLYLIINIIETQEYKTEGLNIYKTIPISPSEAVLGTELKLNLINNNINIKIAPNTQNGQKIRLAGLGIVQNEKVGDMIITIEIKIPKNLSNEEIALYKKLGEISTSNIREQ